MLIYPIVFIIYNKKTMSVPLTSLKKNKQSVPALDEVALEKLRKYYRFEKKEELLEFLKIQCMHD
jgi:hypothetical protein